jgi:hypothetical protein
VGSESRKSRRGIAIIVIVAAIAVAAVIAILVWQYNPGTPSPAQFGDPAPQIQLVYSDNAYEGQLLGVVFGPDAVPELPNPDQPDIASVSVPGITLQQGSAVDLAITGNSSQPDSIALTAYSDSTGVEATAVQQDTASGSFRIDLPPGNYVLVAAATWAADPAEQAPNGYVVYGYRVTVE